MSQVKIYRSDMKLTNTHNLPSIIFEFLKVDFYDHISKGNSISATSLLKPVQQLELERRHGDQIEVDCLDRMWSLFGSAVHSVLEQMKDQEKIERLFTNVLGRSVSGKYDVIQRGIIRDWKVTSAYTIIYGSRMDEWKEQLSIYRWLYFKQKGVILGELGYIEAILRDWADRDAKMVKNYPITPVVEIEIKLLSLEATEKLVTERVQAIIDAEKVTDEKLPRCTDSERWFNKTKQTYIRCEKYCTAKLFCQQLKSENQVIEEAEEVSDSPPLFTEEVNDQHSNRKTKK